MIGLAALMALITAACSSSGGPAVVDGGVETADASEASGRGGTGADAERATSAPAATSAPSATEPPVTTTVAPSTTYPAITEEIRPAPGDVRVMISPSGVLVGVAGQTAGGYVVETPCGGVTTIAWGQPIGAIQVVLDPGHGGDEPGAEDESGMTEAELNLALARRTAAVLTERSVSVVLTRNGDYRIPISRRAALADLIRPAAFVSIHHNTPASRPSATPGTEVFVQSDSDQSRRLGGLIYEEVVAALSGFDVEWTSRDDAGVLVVLNDDGEDSYGIARYPASTSALVEMAYLGNPKEAALLLTPDYLAVGAEALADAIERFLITQDPGSGFVDTPRTFNPSGETGGSGGCVDPPLE